MRWKAAPGPFVELFLRFRARDHVPPFLGEDLLEDRVVCGGPAAELAFLPIAEEHLAQIGLLDRGQAELRRERGRGLMRALE